MAVDANAWITLIEAKVHLGLATPVDPHCDEFLEALINASYKRLEKYIGRQAKRKTYTEHYSGQSKNTLLLLHWPLISIASIHVDQTRVFGSDTLMASSDYFFDVDPDTSVGLVEIFQTTGAGPTFFEKGIRNIKVVYDAGYEPLAENMKHICKMHVAWLFRRAGTEATRSQSLGGKSESYEDIDLPPYIQSWLSPYKDRF